LRIIQRSLTEAICDNWWKLICKIQQNTWQKLINAGTYRWHTIRRTIWSEVSDDVHLPAVRCWQWHIRNVASYSVTWHWLQADQISTAKPQIIHHKMTTLKSNQKSVAANTENKLHKESNSEQTNTRMTSTQMWVLATLQYQITQ